jgi:hypothetical protein|tara:strand:+ start:1415 stop:1711 length:297 start_codon:yes stop_codon:yes gene_type:complete
LVIYILKSKPTIKVDKINTTQYRVEVNDNNNHTIHKVTLNPDIYTKISKNLVAPEKLILASFLFLLERESNQSILSKFNLEIIQTYFPEYLDKIKKYF